MQDAPDFTEPEIRYAILKGREHLAAQPAMRSDWRKALETLVDFAERRMQASSSD